MNNLLSEKDTEALLAILTDQLGVDRSQLKYDTRLEEDLNTDSLMKIEISMAVEERFNLSIPDDRLERIQTVGDIFELLAEMLQRPTRG